VWLFSSRSESTNREVSSLLGLLKTVASHFRVEPVRIPLVMSVREIQRRDQTGTRKWPVVSLQITLSMAQPTALSGSPQNHSLPPDPPGIRRQHRQLNLEALPGPHLPKPCSLLTAHGARW